MEKRREVAEELSTIATEEDIANGVKDEQGVIYSPDGKRLLRYRGNDRYLNYLVREGTEVICDKAFVGNYRENIYGEGYKAFGHFGLASVTIPEGLKRIGCGAFSGCGALELINLPEGLEYIGDFAFNGCSFLRDVVLPASLRKVGVKAFDKCTKIKAIHSPHFRIENDLLIHDTNVICPINASSRTMEIVVPDYITSIGNNAFEKCDQLVSISLPETLKSIGNFAFSKCEKLSFVVLPQCLEDMGIKPFDRGIQITNRSPHFKIENDLLIKGTTVILCTSNVENIVVPDYVTHIGDYAFYNCNKMENIHLPRGLQSIGVNAFQYCEKLKTATLPLGLKSIGDSAFNGCSQLLLERLPNSIETLGKGVFHEDVSKLAHPLFIYDENSLRA